MNKCELCGDEANTVIEIDGINTKVCGLCRTFILFGYDEIENRNRELSNQSLYGV